MNNAFETIVGEQTTIRGNLQGDEDLTIRGRVEGTITLSKTLMVETGGIVLADMDVKNAVVSGVVVGNIRASEVVQINEDGRMVGDITAPRVIIVAGASFKGNVDMGDIDRARPEPPRMETTERPRSTFSSRPTPASPAPARPAPARTRERAAPPARKEPERTSRSTRASKPASKPAKAAPKPPPKPKPRRSAPKPPSVAKGKKKVRKKK